MKPLLSAFFLGATLSAFPLQSAPADDAGSTNAPAAADSGSDGSSTGQNRGQRLEEWRKAFEQLNLTDAQKAQIRQIRSSTSPGKERRQQIMAVLTPEQKEKLKEIIQAHRNGDGG